MSDSCCLSKDGAMIRVSMRPHCNHIVKIKMGYVNDKATFLFLAPMRRYASSSFVGFAITMTCLLLTTFLAPSASIVSVR